MTQCDKTVSTCPWLPTSACPGQLTAAQRGTGFRLSATSSASSGCRTEEGAHIYETAHMHEWLLVTWWSTEIYFSLNTNSISFLNSSLIQIPKEASCKKIHGTMQRKLQIKSPHADHQLTIPTSNTADCSTATVLDIIFDIFLAKLHRIQFWLGLLAGFDV